VFEPGAKHTFDAAAGKNIANPTAALLAAAKMLQVWMEIWEPCLLFHILVLPLGYILYMRSGNHAVYM
jgi:hypothetical protein